MTSNSQVSLPSTPPGDADIVKEVKELKLVVKDLQNELTSIEGRRPPIDKQFSGKGTRALEGNVAFSSYLDKKLTGLSIGQTIVCNQALLNEGDAYNVHTGNFTAPADGVYLFTFFLADLGDHDRCGVNLVVNGDDQISAVVDPNGINNQMAGNTAILRLATGQAVWLKSVIWDDNDLKSSPTERFVTFSGIKMY